jgi:ParB-like chromosome segregation protein Spo0J
MTTRSSSSSPRTARDRLVRIPLSRLRAHPQNANRMDEAFLDKLAANILREDNYPPLIVRPHPQHTGDYELLDGHQRCGALARLGFADARCYVWPCDDATALVLLATLNRLEGQDDPRLRAELLRELASALPGDELALLLPEDASALRNGLALLDLDVDALLADLAQHAGEGDRLRAITFAVSMEDEEAIEEAVRAASVTLDGKNRRGHALALIARAYLGE